MRPLRRSGRGRMPAGAGRETRRPWQSPECACARGEGPTRNLHVTRQPDSARVDRSRIPAIINRFFARGRAKAPSVRFPRALPSPTSPSR